MALPKRPVASGNMNNDENVYTPPTEQVSRNVQPEPRDTLAFLNEQDSETFNITPGMLPPKKVEEETYDLYEPIDTDSYVIPEISVPTETPREQEYSYTPEPVQQFIEEETTTPAVQYTTAPTTPQDVSNDEEYEDDINALTDEYESFTPEDVEAARELLDLINDDKSSEILMNGPETILFKQNGQRIHAKNIAFSSRDAYHEFIDDLILNYTDTSDRLRRKDGKGDNDIYLIEGQLTLPNFDDENAPALLARVHIIAPPVVPNATVTIAKKSRYQLRLKEILNNGAMSLPMAEFLKAITRGRATTIFSGISGSGKTTLLEALSHEFDPNDRVVVVEETPELRLPITDIVYLNSTSAKPGQDANKIVSLDWLVAAANRMRPTRVIVGEVRGAEMGEFLIAANSGADGSMTTMHASTPQLTLDKMVSLALKSTTSKSEGSVARDIASTVQVIVQMSLIDGRHVVTQIQEVTRAIRKETGGIVTQTLFEYDKDKNTFNPVQRPSTELTGFLNQRGVNIDPAWWRGAV